MASIKSFFVRDMLLLLPFRSPNKYLSKKALSGGFFLTFSKKIFVMKEKLQYIISTVEQHQQKGTIMVESNALGDKIRALREVKKQSDPRFSQRKFAEMLNLSPTYLNKVESGELVPAAETIIRIADLLDADRDELLALAEKVDPALNAIILEKPKAMAAFLRTASGMSEAQLAQFQRFMEAEKKATEEAKKE